MAGRRSDSAGAEEAAASASEGSSIRTMLSERLSIFRSATWTKSSVEAAGAADSGGCASIAGRREGVLGGGRWRRFWWRIGEGEGLGTRNCCCD